jgi:hypothetical protein
MPKNLYSPTEVAEIQSHTSRYVPAPGEDVLGFMTPAELWWLHDTATRMTSVIEIGSFCGRSTSALAAGCPGTVYAIDHFKGSPEHQPLVHRVNPREEFAKVLVQYPNITLLEGESTALAAKYPDLRADLVFIDGAHDFPAVLADLQAWAPRARRVVCGHDGHYSSVAKALVWYFDEAWTFASTIGTIWKHVL